MFILDFLKEQSVVLLRFRSKVDSIVEYTFKFLYNVDKGREVLTFVGQEKTWLDSFQKPGDGAKWRGIAEIRVRETWRKTGMSKHCSVRTSHRGGGGGGAGPRPGEGEQWALDRTGAWAKPQPCLVYAFVSLLVGCKGTTPLFWMLVWKKAVHFSCLSFMTCSWD